MTKRTALLAIDVQRDFHDIPGAALPVTGSVKDTERLCEFVKKFNPSSIFTSLDSHHSMDISHPAWWKKPNGDFVDPFTLITASDVENGKYIPRIDPKRSLEYVKHLEANGEFMHFIWPEHCLIGTQGHALMPEYHQALADWSKKNLTWVNYINKGVNPFTEHFGIFRANVEMAEDANTQINQGLFQTLNSFDEIYLAGQARSHCVVNSMKQLLEIAPALASKLIILEDGMSDVAGLPQDFYDMVNKMYTDAIAKGVRTAKITDL